MTNRLRRFGNPKQIAPPALVILNLNTDQLIRRYSFTSSDSTDNSKTFYANVYFHALFSTKEFLVSIFVLQNETYAKSKDLHGDYTYVGDRGANGQTASEVFDEKNNVLLYTQLCAKMHLAAGMPIKRTTKKRKELLTQIPFHLSFQMM